MINNSISIEYKTTVFNFTESEMARQKFESQATEKLLAVKSILPRMSRKYWKCDPDQHVEGETFVRLTHLLQVIYYLLYRRP